MNFLICLDQLLLSVLTLGEASPWQTCSAAAWNMERKGRFFGFWRPCIDAIFGVNHCHTRYDTEIQLAKALAEKPP